MLPLHLAALNAHSDCCKKLLSSGNLSTARRLCDPAAQLCVIPESFSYSYLLHFLLFW